MGVRSTARRVSVEVKALSTRAAEERFPGLSRRGVK